MTSPQNRYELLGTLGAGATSRVEKARDTLIGRTVALKTFLQGFGSRDLLQQFHREAQIIGRLAHPCIVSLYDVGTNADGLPYFVMEYVDGNTLEDVLAQGPLPVARAAVWAADLAEALARAHKAKIIHGDVKPANVLVTPEGRVKLSDFGVARFATQISGTGSVLGTPAYLSPEQINGHLQDARSDLFSLGIILYHMLSGVRPFQGTSVGAVCAQILSNTPPPPSHYNRSVPPTLDRVVMRCLAKDPAERYVSAESLAASLYPFARNIPVPEKSTVAWWKRPFQPIDAVYCGAVIAALIAGFLVARNWQARHLHGAQVLAASGMTRVGEPYPAQAASGAESTPSAVSTAEMSIVDYPVLKPVRGDAVEASDTRPLTSLARMSAKPSPRKKAFAAADSRPSKAPVPSQPKLEPVVSDVARVAPLPRSLASTPIRAMMHVNITSAVADEILAVYAGPDLLLSTPLDEAHLHETLHFECPISAGPHALRVALYHSDQSLHMQKEGLAEVAAGGSGLMEIHVNRRTKLLVRHEAALEVQWPGMVAPSATVAPVAQATAPANTSNP
jgi:hypothetical protein